MPELGPKYNFIDKAQSEPDLQKAAGQGTGVRQVVPWTTSNFWIVLFVCLKGICYMRGLWLSTFTYLQGQPYLPLLQEKFIHS